MKKYLIFITLFFAAVTGCDNPYSIPDKPAYYDKSEIEIHYRNQRLENNQEINLGITSDTIEQEIVVKNTGDKPLSVYDLDIDGDESFTIEGSISNIGAYSKKTITLKYNPSSPDEEKAVLKIKSNSENNDYFIVNFTGQKPPAPSILVRQSISSLTNDSTFWFDDIHIKDSQTKSFEVINMGNADLIIDSISISDETDFRISKPVSTYKLEPYETTYFNVEYSPASLEIDPVFIEINSNDDCNSNIKICLQGSASPELKPEITLSIDDNQLFNNSTLDFGTIKTGKDHEEKTVTISNTGNVELLIYSISLVSYYQFQVDKTSTGIKIAPGDSTTFKLIFNTTLDGVYSQVLTINSSSKDNSTIMLNLSGESVTPPAPVLKIIHDDTLIESDNFIALKFDNSQAYEPLKKEITAEKITIQLMNIGNKELNISDIILSNSDDFYIEALTPVINVDDAENLVIYFKPQTAGDKTLTVTIVSDDEDNSEFLVNFKGTAVEDIRPDIYFISPKGNQKIKQLYKNNFEYISGYAEDFSEKGIEQVWIKLGDSIPSQMAAGKENWEIPLPIEYRPTKNNPKTIYIQVYDKDLNKSNWIEVTLIFLDL